MTRLRCTNADAAPRCIYRGFSCCIGAAMNTFTAVSAPPPLHRHSFYFRYHVSAFPLSCIGIPTAVASTFMLLIGFILLLYRHSYLLYRHSYLLYDTYLEERTRTRYYWCSSLNCLNVPVAYQRYHSYPSRQNGIKW